MESAVLTVRNPRSHALRGNAYLTHYIAYDRGRAAAATLSITPVAWHNPWHWNSANTLFDLHNHVLCVPT